MKRKFPFTKSSIFKNYFEINLNEILFWSWKPEINQAVLNQCHEHPDKIHCSELGPAHSVRDRKKIKIKKKLAIAHREYLLDNYFTSFILVIIIGPEGTCFILSFIRTEERFQTQDTRNCIGTEKGRMFEDGNSIEEGNLT